MGRAAIELDELRNQLAELLEQFPRGAAFGTPMFNAISNITVSTAFEAVALRQNGDNLEVYLTQRAMTESAYPGEWHCPGSFQRADEKVADVFTRLSKREFGAQITGYQYVGWYLNTAEERGTTNSQVFVVKVDPGDKGQWFPVNGLPPNTVCHHRTIIKMAVRFSIGDREPQLIEAPRA